MLIEIYQEQKWIFYSYISLPKGMAPDLKATHETKQGFVDMLCHPRSQVLPSSDIPCCLETLTWTLASMDTKVSP